MPENGGLPCGINGLRVPARDAARRTPSGQGEPSSHQGALWPEGITREGIE